MPAIWAPQKVCKVDHGTRFMVVDAQESRCNWSGSRKRELVARKWHLPCCVSPCSPENDASNPAQQTHTREHTLLALRADNSSRSFPLPLTFALVASPVSLAPINQIYELGHSVGRNGLSWLGRHHRKGRPQKSGLVRPSDTSSSPSYSPSKPTNCSPAT